MIVVLDPTIVHPYEADDLVANDPDLASKLRIPIIAITHKDYLFIKSTFYRMLKPPQPIPDVSDDDIARHQARNANTRSSNITQSTANTTSPLYLSSDHVETILIPPIAPEQRLDNNYIRRVRGIITCDRVGGGLLATHLAAIKQSIPDHITDMCQYYLKDKNYRKLMLTPELLPPLVQMWPIPCRLPTDDNIQNQALHTLQSPLGINIFQKP